MLHDAARRCDWLPMREAAQLYRVTDETMLAWLDAGAFTVLREGRIVWVSRAELEAGLRRRPPAARSQHHRMAGSA